MAHSAVFWTCPTIPRWIRSELDQGRLRQGWGVEGWGVEGCQLIENGVQVPFSTWAQRFAVGDLKFWGGTATDESIATRHYILMRMLRLQSGDQLVIPSVPDNGFMTLARVRKGYKFDTAHFRPQPLPNGLDHDFGHVIDVDPKQLAEVPYNSSLDAGFVASKFSNYRSAITFVRAREYRAAVDRLFDAHLAS